MAACLARRPRGRPRRRGAPRARAPELAREPARRLGRPGLGRGGGARPGRPGVALARRRREPRRRARGVRPDPRSRTRRGAPGEPSHAGRRRRGPARRRAVAVASVLPPEARSRVRTLAEHQDRRPRSASGSASGATRSGSPRPARSWAPGSAPSRTRCPASRPAAGDIRVEHAENDYLELLAEGGGSPAVVLAGSLGARRASRSRSGACATSRTASRAACAAGALAGVAALARPQRLRLQPPDPVERAALRPARRVRARTGRPRRKRRRVRAGDALGDARGSSAALSSRSRRSWPSPRPGPAAASTALRCCEPPAATRPACAGSRSSATRSRISAAGPPTPRPGWRSPGCACPLAGGGGRARDLGYRPRPAVRGPPAGGGASRPARLRSSGAQS